MKVAAATKGSAHITIAEAEKETRPCGFLILGIFSLMETETLFRILESANEKPAAFSVYTANQFWTDEHRSEQMLAYHLNDETDLSSRSMSFIDESVC